MKKESFCQGTNSLNDKDFLQQVYQTYLKRDPDEDGEIFYLQQLQKKSLDRECIVNIFSNSEEFQNIDLWENKILKMPNLELIFYHVPQTAGTTFNKILDQVYGKGNVLYYVDGKLFYYDQKLFLDNVFSSAMVKAITGHFQYKHLSCYYKTIIWVRHPILRLISLYCYYQSIPLNPNNPIQKCLIEEDLSLLDFAKIPTVQNGMSIYFYQDISQYTFVGIYEFFREDLLDLKKLMNYPDFQIPFCNTNPNPRYHTLTEQVLKDKKLLESLISLNYKDMELYQRALDLRSKRQGLSNSLAQFKLN